MTQTNDPLKLAREAFTSSTNYFDASIRKQIEQDIRQFQGLHPSGSKYLADVNRSRSRLFRPKTRTAIRKNEAVAAEAFFSTNDVVSMTAEDDSDPMQQASAAVLQEIVQYRLTKSIPWFLTCIGGYQDALSVGVVISYQCWRYDEAKKIDKPDIKLLPVENIRFDPAADWRDPVNTSPYWIEMIPMYVKDVRARMHATDDKTGNTKWIAHADSVIMAAVQSYSDTTRLQREQGRTDSKDQAQGISDFSIVWVHKNIIEIDGVDMLYYTLGTTELLSAPVPLVDRYAHGRRPYVLGSAIIETHKNYPSSLSRISRDVQAEINDIANLRIDSVKFAMNKRYFAKRNTQVDVRSLVRNVPGSVTLMNDPEKDVKVIEFNDVTGSSYQEQDRLNLDFDDITGSFSGSSVQSNRKLNETVGGMELLDGSANQVSGYQLRTFVETWVEPVLRQLVLLEQHYETNETILAIAGKRANLVQRFGIDAVTDDLLNRELTINVGVGMGATNPQEQVKKFMQAMSSLRDLLADGILEQKGLDFKEVCKELFGKLGYRDGDRFFGADKAQDPMVTQLQQQVQELMQQLAQKEDPRLTQARIDEIRAKIASMIRKDKNVDTDTIAKMVGAMFSAMQAAEVVTAVPHVAPAADAIMVAAGAQDPNFVPGDAGAPIGIDDVSNKKTGMSFTPGVGDTSPNTPAAPVGATEGMQQGIETMEADSVGMANGGLVDRRGDGLSVDETTGIIRSPSGGFVASDDLTPEQSAHNDRAIARTYGDPNESASIGKPFETFYGTGNVLENFADGGLITGPGTGTSDGIPAVIDGEQPAAVSAGEYKIPAAVVAKLGVDFFVGLVNQFHTPVEGEPAPQSAAPVDLESGDFIIPADVVAAVGKDFFDALVEQNA